VVEGTKTYFEDYFEKLNVPEPLSTEGIKF